MEGNPQEGLAALAEAFTRVEQTEERLHEPEMYRLRGELTLQSSVQRLEFSVTDPRSLIPDAQGEACFQKAIDIARQQQAKSWELRATTSLARL